MRLSKPTLYQNISVYAEEELSSSSAALLHGQSNDIAIGNDHSVLSHLLVLPYSFGFVFTFIILSTFRFYFCDLEMYFWVKYSLPLFHCIIRVIKYFEMLYLK